MLWQRSCEYVLGMPYHYLVELGSWVGHELCCEDVKNIMQHNEKIKSVSMVLGCAEGEITWGTSRLQVSRDVN
jgi:hypothetical protein